MGRPERSFSVRFALLRNNRPPDSVIGSATGCQDDGGTIDRSDGPGHEGSSIWAVDHLPFERRMIAIHAFKRTLWTGVSQAQAASARLDSTCRRSPDLGTPSAVWIDLHLRPITRTADWTGPSRQLLIRPIKGCASDRDNRAGPDLPAVVTTLSQRPRYRTTIGTRLRTSSSKPPPAPRCHTSTGCALLADGSLELSLERVVTGVWVEHHRGSTRRQCAGDSRTPGRTFDVVRRSA